MPLVEFETLLKQTFGLDAASIGSSAIERAVQERQSACNLKDSEAYWQKVSTSDKELQELIETVVVPETWFFRDREAFAALARVVVQEWLPTHPDGVLRLLSLPCATGEEAYSMAMALLDAGVPSNRFSIEAIDISARALARAEGAVYGKNSFRGIELGFRASHFEATARGYRLNDAVRRQVQFRQGNIFDHDLLPGSEIYDMIFCRNMLIYFDRATQDRVIDVLRRLLAAKGVLFVGPSETSLLLNHHFVSTKVPMAFAFRKAAPVSRKTKAVAAHPPIHRHHHHVHAVTPHKAAVVSPPPKPEVNLDEAAAFADQGQLAEAEKRCEDYLRAHGPSAKVFYLLGLVRDAAGQPSEATGFYRKALYLDPQHHDALLHLSLMLEKQGDKAGAKVLNDRARRLEEKGRK